MIRQYFVLCLLYFSVPACSSLETLKIAQINECLEIGRKVESVSQCIEQYKEYEKSEPNTLGKIALYRVSDYCAKNDYGNCSHIGLIEALSIGKEDIKDPASGEKKGEIEVILNPYLLFSSRSQNLGGRIIMLYIFYNNNTQRVIGWVNLGSIVDKYRFNK